MYRSKQFFLSLAWLLSVHAVSLVFLTLFRLVELACLGSMITDSHASVLTALVRGVWFDNVVASYVMIAPLAVTLVAAAFGYAGRGIRKVFTWWFAILYAVVLMASAANTPYFQYFFKNINSSIFEWFGYAATTAGMVFQEKSYMLHIALYFIATAAYTYIIVLLRRRFDRMIGRERSDGRYPGPFFMRLAIAVAFTLLCLFGIRGRMGYNPIKVSQAYYCNDPFLNQLGISPAFNLLTSALDDMRKENADLHLMPDAEAVTIARRELGITGAIDSMHIVRRQITAEGEMRKPNVVVILMESMSASLMQTFGNTRHLTPTLDSLYNHSLAFTRCYSAGIHTNHGMTAALYSFPAMMFRNLMKGTVTPHRTGLPTVLHEVGGYHNMFFMTHEAQYDNMKAFFTTNGYDDIYSQEDYPEEQVVNSFGVQDHFLFSYALGKIRQQAKTRKPFFATILTISNHPPYVIPPFFKPHSKDKETQIVEYADWALGDFLKKAEREPWYKNTIFVIMADHGKLVGKATTEAPESYNHIPLMIFGPGVPVMRYDALAEQIDVMPTLLAMLNMSYTYDGFGQDLLHQKRRMAFYSADNQLIARDQERVFVYNPKAGKRFCYIIGKDGKLQETKMSAAFKPLERYVFAMIQTAQVALKRQ